MTNFERWRILTKNFPSPDSWIDFGFYYLISACLQRRVWLYGEGEDGGELFPNMYVAFVGPPGSGKGLVLGTVARFLRFHKYEKGGIIKTNTGHEKPPLFPLGADSVTFEELLSDVADSIRRIPRPDSSVYIHTSYAFVLEELDSLFKRKTLDVVAFLKNAYDCKSFDYRTKHQGKQLLRNLCVCFMAGTQPDFLFEARKNGIFGQGFASRTLFLFEEHERDSTFHISEKSPEQKQYEVELLAWIKRLAGLYGAVRYDAETYSFLESWYRDYLLPTKDKAPPRMKEFYARMKVTMIKLALAVHFGESQEMTIGIEPFIRAIDILKSVIPKLEKGLGLTGRNELYGFTKRIHEFIISRGTVPLKDVIISFAVDMQVDEIKASLEELTLAGSIKTRQEKGTLLYYV